LKEVFDEVFVDAGEEGEFFDGDEFVFGFAEGVADFLHELTCGTITKAGDVFNVSGVDDYTERNGGGC
jgi:hypothetical protein